MRIRRAAQAAGLLSVLVVATACSRGEQEPKAAERRPAPTVPVAVATVEQRDTPLVVQAIGTVEAYSVVSVRAQVGGELQRVHIKEGQDVKKGDLLFTIDPRPLQAAVAQAEATLAKDRGQVQQARAVHERDGARVAQARAALARDEAQATNARTQERRYAELLERDLIAREQYDQFKTSSESLNATLAADRADVTSAEETVRADQAAVQSAEQTVRADEAAVENAKLQLAYTEIRSPIDGRAGSLQLHEGNIVRASGTNDSTLIVINQVEPIYVSFTVPQQQLPAIKHYMAEGRLSVDAVPAGEPRAARGFVTFVDNAVDPTTGTIRLKATFDNGGRRLWPGQFVNVSLTLATQQNAIVVPSVAVQTGQRGTYVFVVKPDSTVDVRPVQVTRTQGSETIVAQGLKPGERVVTDGQPRLVAGTKVDVRGARGAERGQAASPAPPGANPGATTPAPPAASPSAIAPTPPDASRSAAAPAAPSAGRPAPAPRETTDRPK